MYIFTFVSEIRQIQCQLTDFEASNARGLQGQVHWTSIKFKASALICRISAAKVNANLLTSFIHKRKTQSFA